jgi:hypothetical protein
MSSRERMLGRIDAVPLLVHGTGRFCLLIEVLRTFSFLATGTGIGVLTLA